MREGTLFAVVRFRHPWPPKTESEAFSKEADGAYLRLSVDIQGRLVLQVSTDEESRSYVFQPLHITGGGRTLVELTWTADSASLKLNNKPVMLNVDLEGRVFHLETSNDLPPAAGPILEDIDPAASASHNEFMFLSTLQDIDHKLQMGGKYNMIRAAGYLRSLLLDQTPLVNIINRDYGLTVRFETLSFGKSVQDATGTEPEFGMTRIDPRSDRIKTMKLQLEEFLGSRCFEGGGLVATVRDVINACANARGAIHFKRPKRERTAEIQLLDWENTFQLLGEEPTVLVLSDICRITLRGLQPLAKAVMLNAANNSSER